MTRTTRPARLLVPLAALLALLPAGCDPSARGTSSSLAASPASCLPAGLGASPSAPASPSVPAAPAAALSADGSPSPVPDLALPCLTGTGSVRLRALHVPAVINLWASWCAPCRVELPAVQRYAVRAANRVAVIGVDTTDERSRAGSVIEDRGLTYPNLRDDRGRLLAAVGRVDLPVTLFVDAQGTVRYQYFSGQPLSEASLAQLVRTYLGVVS